MKILIDGQPCDRFRRRLSIPCFDARRLSDLDALRQGRSMTFTLPRTPHNDRMMGDARDLHTGFKFNAQSHTARITHNGATLIEGSVRLVETTDRRYTLEIRTGDGNWANDAALRTLADSTLDFRMTLTPFNIEKGWKDSSPVKFFPVARDRYPDSNNPDDLKDTQQIYSVNDYHPFIALEPLLRRSIEDSGYTLRSRFFSSPFFRSLHISGAYARRDTSALVNRMGFKASRSHDITATASYAGMVYADPQRDTNSLGNLMQTASPFDPDPQGHTRTDLYNNGGCLTMDYGQMTYTPKMEVTASFEYHLKYTTSHRIVSRTRLRGFDSVYLGPGTNLRFAIANRYEDRRPALKPDYQYRVIVFDHSPGDTYELTLRRNEGPERHWLSFSGRSAQVVSPTNLSDHTAVLWYTSNGVRRPYPGDWALYDGFIGEFGTTTLEFRVVSAPEKISPASPKTFFDIHFYGAEPDMQLTLHRESSMKVVFDPGPGYGANLTFGDIAHHPVRHIELFEAVRQMFNLRIFTEQATRTVVIEPDGEFYPDDRIVDWSDRTVDDHSVKIADMALDAHRHTELSYLEPQGRIDPDLRPSWGRWTMQTGNSASKPGRLSLCNPLFHPAVSIDRQVATAPSALLLSVGDRDAVEDTGLNFPMVVVSFLGMHPLPEGERWSDSSAEYPLAAFHFAGDGALPPSTLCFEDRDHATGLHVNYDRPWRERLLRERITLRMQITADEMAALLLPGVAEVSIRSLFRISTGRECILARLESIDDYDPDDRTAVCTFCRTLKDQP